jgi:hypothetical protein
MARLAYGSWLVADAQRLVGAAPTDRRFRIVARILGLRHIVQAIALTVWPTATARQLGAAADGLHAATDAGCVLLDRRRTRPAAFDGTIALAFAVDALVAGQPR